MEMKRIIVVLFLVIIPCNSIAEIYTEIGLEVGGDTLVSTSEEDLNIAGGVKLALGFQRYIGGFEDVGLLFSLGYLFDDIDASNGSAETDALVFEFIYFRLFGPHRVGTGGSYHINPRYKDNLDGIRTKINFDDSLGFVAQYIYSIMEGYQLGFRYTIMDYETNGTKLDADSFGVFFSTSF